MDILSTLRYIFTSVYVSEVDIAFELFGTLGVGSRNTLSNKAKKILSYSEHRTDVLKEIIKLCPNPTTAKELYIVSTAYVWLGACFRQEAIEYLLKYISVGATWEGTPKDTVNIFGYDINQKLSCIAKVYYDLGQCYEKEYMFEEALSAYKKASEYDGHFAYYIVCTANIYVKLGNYEDALKTLYEAKNSEYYKVYYYKTGDGKEWTDKDYIDAIDRAVTDIKDKQNRGYIYRPRKSK